MAYDTGKWKSKAIKKEGVIGSGNLLNPSFEDWTLVGETYEIDDWDFFSFGDAEVKIASYARSEDSVTGNYSIELTSYADDYGAIGETKTGLTPGDWKIIKINTKSLNSTQFAIGLLGDEGETNIILNWVTGQWGEGSFEDDYLWFFNVGTDWNETISIPFQVPDSGILQIVGMAIGEEGAVTLIDDFDIYDYTPAEDVALFEYVSDEDATKLTNGDYSVLFRTTGGTPKNLLGLNYDNKLDTSADYLGSEKEFRIPETRTYADSALSGLTGICILNKNPPTIDLKNIKVTKIANAPVLGKAFLPTHLLVLTTNAISPNKNAKFSLSVNQGGDVLNGNITPVSYSTSFGRMQMFIFNQYDPIKITGDLNLDLFETDTGTKCHVKVYVLGFYIDDFKYNDGGYTS